MTLLIQILILTVVGAWTVWIWRSEWLEVKASWDVKDFKRLTFAGIRLCGDVYLTKFIVATFGIGGSMASGAFGLILSNLVSLAFFLPRKPKRAKS